MALNVQPLSECISFGLPRRAINRLRLMMNSVASNDFNKSRYNALVRLHPYKARYALLSVPGFDW